MHIQEQVNLAYYSTFRIGGEAEFFVEVSTKEEVREAIVWAREEGIPWRVIGSGSNILFGDGTLPGLTIRNGIIGVSESFDGDTILVEAGAGMLCDDVVLYACERGWWGLENLSAIPGTVGAMPIQNVGAYGVEVSSVVRSVLVYDINADSFVHMSPKDCQFSYRHSIFKQPQGSHYVILKVTFAVTKACAPNLAYKDLKEHFASTDSTSLDPHAVRQAVIAIRSKKFPDWRTVGTAGSFFKNPIMAKEAYKELLVKHPGLPGYIERDGRVKVPLGWIIDRVCGMRGLREGDVGTYSAQALVVVNYNRASAVDVKNFAKKISLCVKEKTNIDIEWEVTSMG